MITTAQSETGKISQLLLKRPEAAFSDQRTLDANWRALNYLDRPDFAKAVAEYDIFVDLLQQQGMAIDQALRSRAARWRSRGRAPGRCA